jgi:hypothetical protein
LGRFSRYRDRYITCRAAAAPRRPHWPLSRRSNRSSLLVLCPLGLSVHHRGSADTLPGRLTHATARNVEFHCPTRGEKGGANAIVAGVMAVAADKLLESHGLGHGGQFLKVTGNRVTDALAEQEDGGGDKGNSEPDTLTAWQLGTGKHATLQSVTGPPIKRPQPFESTAAING